MRRPPGQNRPLFMVISSVSSDEPPTQPGNSGARCPDAIIEDSVAHLRAERAPRGNGRVYTVGYTAIGTTGTTCTSTVQVCVPRWPGMACIDDGPLYDATRCDQSIVTSPRGGLEVGDTGNDVRIRFQQETVGPALLEVYDVRGRLVRRLLQGTRAAGTHEVRWDGIDAAGHRAPTGIYLYRLQVHY